MGLLDARRPRRTRAPPRSSRSTEDVLAPQSQASGRAAHAHPPGRVDDDAGAGREGGRHADAADAGGRPHGAHGLAHLPARGPLRRRDEEQPARDRRRRGLHHAVPGAGPVSDGLLPAQHPLPVVRGDRRRAVGRWRSTRRRRSRRRSPTTVLAEMPLTAGFRVVPYWANVRFGRWDEILREPAPPASNVFLTAAWHFARGMAFVATGKVADAETGAGGADAAAWRTSRSTRRSSRPTPAARS